MFAAHEIRAQRILSKIPFPLRIDMCILLE